LTSAYTLNDLNICMLTLSYTLNDVKPLSVANHGKAPMDELLCGSVRLTSAPLAIFDVNVTSHPLQWTPNPPLHPTEQCGYTYCGLVGINSTSVLHLTPF
ncbi:hypothetical protein VIGAN_09134400, partial [Vigna angularis var. angularis]